VARHGHPTMRTTTKIALVRALRIEPKKANWGEQLSVTCVVGVVSDSISAELEKHCT
jgi:hypothetical protein